MRKTHYSLIYKAIAGKSGWADQVSPQQQASASIGSQFVMSQTLNFLVPSDGSTHTVLTAFLASGVGYQVNWNQFRLDQGLRFDPQGAWIDNTAGTSALVATSQATGFSFTVGPGGFAATPFPAAPNDTWTITGGGNVKIFWTDFPVFPFGVSLGSTVAGQNVSVTNSPIVQLGPKAVGAVPYQVEQIAQPSTFVTVAGTGNIAIAAPANQNLRRLRLSLSGNATIGAAGIQTLLVQLNGVTIFEDFFYMPVAAPALPNAFWYEENIPFDTTTFTNGATGNLALTFNTALTGGEATLSGWFSAN